MRCLLEPERPDLLLRDVLAIKAARGAYVLGMLQREGWQMVAESRDIRLEKRAR